MTLLLINETLLEINHIFVCLKSAPDKQSLEKIGLICSENLRNNPQQGTASMIIFFENTYIEFIWVENSTMAEIYAMYSGIDYISRSYSPQKVASPFGIALHQRPDTMNPENTSLSSSNHQPPEEFINFAVENLAAQTEPICFMIPESISFSNIFNPFLEAHRKLINHPLGIKKLTNTRIAISKTGNLTNPISMLEAEGIVEIQQSASPLLELIFDEGSQGESIDLKTIGIPIILKY
ncbi:MAG: hypothetical protein MJK14_07450 [Rivularia sp. ALOHA_DT_140]|nr:hypothetical protein [Rivularia sp. ALOHA_DT_140]